MPRCRSANSVYDWHIAVRALQPGRAFTGGRPPNVERTCLRLLPIRSTRAVLEMLAARAAIWQHADRPIRRAPHGLRDAAISAEDGACWTFAAGPGSVRHHTLAADRSVRPTRAVLEMLTARAAIWRRADRPTRRALRGLRDATVAAEDRASRTLAAGPGGVRHHTFAADRPVRPTRAALEMLAAQAAIWRRADRPIRRALCRLNRLDNCLSRPPVTFRELGHLSPSIRRSPKAIPRYLADRVRSLALALGCVRPVLIDLQLRSTYHPTRPSR
jgi:hypothetical protein